MRLAIYHNLPSGGAKRALFEMVFRLAAEHDLTEFSLTSADPNYCNLRDFVNHQHIFDFTPISLARSPFGRINPLLRSIDLLRLCNIQKKIAKIIDEGKYDLVFIHGCRFGQTPALLQYLNTPSIYYCAEPPRFLYEPQIPHRENGEGKKKMQNLLDRYDLINKLYRWVYKHIDRKNLKSASRILVDSAYTRENVYRIYQINSLICYLGVDSKKFEKQKVEKEELVISVGALNRLKGFDDLILAVGLIEREIRPKVIIITNQDDFHEREFLTDLAQSNGVNLNILVSISEDELVGWYNKAKVTVYTPILEPFGLVPLESMSVGTPVVGVREAGVRETVVEGITGFLVNREVDKIALRIVQLLKDSTLREQMGDRGYQYVREKWTWEQTILELEDQFGLLIG